MIHMDLNHVYTHRTNGIYTAVSTIKKAVEPPFNKEYWLPYKALQRLIPSFDVLKGKVFMPNLDKYKAMVSPQELKEAMREIELEWEATKIIGLDRGISYHDLKEKRALLAGSVRCPLDGLNYRTKDVHDIDSTGKASRLTSLLDLEPGYCYTEIQVWCDQYRYAGTLDKLFVIGPKKIYILDYKTDKKFEFRNRFNNLLYPMDKYPKCEASIYGLQLELYALPFRDLGYTVEAKQVLHSFNGIETLHTLNGYEKAARDTAEWYYNKVNNIVPLKNKDRWN